MIGYSHEGLTNKHLDLVDPIANAELLNSVAKEVDRERINSDSIQFIIDEMLRMATGRGKNGEDTRQMVGLAAPQIGESKRIITIDVTATGALQEQNIEAIINPELSSENGDLVDGREGCWSCGNFCANVPRYSHVTLRGLSRDGKSIEHQLEGFVARIAQHEVDHLNGIRCIDRVPLGEEWRLHDVKPVELTKDGVETKNSRLSHDVITKNREDNLNYAPLSMYSFSNGLWYCVLPVIMTYIVLPSSLYVTSLPGRTLLSVV
jgi:peptide deformylase